MSRVRHGGFFDIAEWIVRINRRMDDLDRIEIPGSFIGARYTTNAGQSITSGAAAAIVNFEDLVYDTHSAVTTGASWKFTAPITGYYHVTAAVLFATTTTWAESEVGLLELHVNGSRVSEIGRVSGLDSSGGTQYLKVTGSDTAYLTTSQYLDIRVYQNSGGTLALLNNGEFNYVTISRVG